LKKTVAALACALSIFSTQAFASGCYTAREVEAEQGLRIHSELMVIGLTCLKMPGGQETYAKYARFTNKNQALIGGYEESIISWYRSQGVSNPEKELHTLRTNLANDISRHAIEMGALGFCQHFTPRIDTALAMDQTTLRRWAQHVWPGTPVSHPTCVRLEQ
jgi:hypothetical protein